MPEPEVVTVSTIVHVEPDRAFAVFTEDVDAWWQRGPRFRWNPGRAGELRFESFVGGRFIEVYDGGSGEDYEELEVGRVRVWAPGQRLVFDFRGRDFAPDEVTEVEVRFEAVAEGTRVTLEHRGWDRLAGDHPARHGLGRGPAFTGLIGTVWGELLLSFRYRLRRNPVE